MSEVATEISPEDLACRRGNGRASLSFPTAIMLSNGQFPCTLEDISLGGARISTNHKLEPGRSMWLKLDEYEAFGTVAWASDGEYGIEFEDRLPKVVVMQMQGFSVNLDEYEAAQCRGAAKDWVVGEGRVTKSPLMRLLDVVSPKSREEFSSCAQCDSGFPCATHCGHKRFRSYKRAHRMRITLYLGLAAIIGALLGIGSELIG